MDGVSRLTKPEMRAALLRARRELTDAQRQLDAVALIRHLPTFVRPGQAVCAYVPVGTEPGTVGLLDGLLALGARVLLPVTRHDSAGSPNALQWGDYRPGRLVEARYGLLEPPAPWLDAGAVGNAAIILVPALAVDRAGRRLGRGAGFYDRSLASARPGTRLVAVVRDEELVDHVPAEPHDVPMTHALTPGHGLVQLRE